MLYGELSQVKPGDVEYTGILIRVPNPPKAAALRLPTNAEMLEWLDSGHMIRRSIGRRKSKTEIPPNTGSDLALFGRIRLDKDGAEFDEYEAGNAIAKLTFYEIAECSRSGSDYRIVMRTPWGDTVHYVTSPTQRDLTFYRRSLGDPVILPHGVEDFHFKHGTACEFYDSVAVKVEGYALGMAPKDVPPHHKSAVAAELAAAMDDLDPALDPLA
jgi:hypothetical protein